MVQSVLGIDAAWTLKQPSGVALVGNPAGQWRLLAACASYGHFVQRADASLPHEPHPLGSTPDPQALLHAAASISGSPPDVVAIDMPMAFDPITGRRVADNAVSREYGGRKCGTHTPSVARPGPISDQLRERFELAGYPLRTLRFQVPGLIEVYPHPALVELTGAPERLPYKTAKTRTYWRGLRPAERRERLLDEWRTIVGVLDGEIAGVSGSLKVPNPHASGVELKAFEDMLDAVICAWTGIQVLTDEAVPYGDECATIWIPRPRAC